MLQNFIDDKSTLQYLLMTGQQFAAMGPEQVKELLLIQFCDDIKQEPMS